MFFSTKGVCEREGNPNIKGKKSKTKSLSKVKDACKNQWAVSGITNAMPDSPKIRLLQHFLQCTSIIVFLLPGQI